MILGGGAGSRLYPLTKQRAKPAVPIGGAYRLIDVPMSNCINSGISKIYILTQFNSTSLNRCANAGASAAWTLQASDNTCCSTFHFTLLHSTAAGSGLSLLGTMFNPEVPCWQHLLTPAFCAGIWQGRTTLAAGCALVEMGLWRCWRLPRRPLVSTCTSLVQVNVAALPCTAHCWPDLCTLALLLCYQLHPALS